MHNKTADLFGRDREWTVLSRFLEPSRGAALGLVYGRRRQGKSHLLHAFTEAAGGFYFEAAQTGTEQNLNRFAREWSAWSRSATVPSFTGWDDALAAALGASPGAPIILDEFNYLVTADQSLPSTIQRLFGPRSALQSVGARLVLCGSAFTVMSQLLSGTAPLRGRADFEMVISPFAYREAAAFWGVERDPEVAFRLHALLGGTPAYRTMCRGKTPRTARELPAWAAEHLLEPSAALFREGRVVVDEDPSVPDRTLSWSILSAVAAGCSTRSEIAREVGRDATALSRPLEGLVHATLMTRDDDVVRARRSRYLLSEPIIATHQVLIAPHERALSRGGARQVWDGAEHAIASRLFATAFETVSREWLEDNATRVLGREPTAVGWTNLSCPGCPSGQSAHQIDLAAVRREASGRFTIDAIGEVKWQADRVALVQLERLEHVRDRFGNRAEGAKLTLVSRSGFSAELERVARRRTDVILVDLDELYA